MLECKYLSLYLEEKWEYHFVIKQLKEELKIANNDAAKKSLNKVINLLLKTTLLDNCSIAIFTDSDEVMIYIPKEPFELPFYRMDTEYSFDFVPEESYIKFLKTQIKERDIALQRYQNDSE